MLAAAVLAMSAAGPALARPATPGLAPGSGIVKRDRPPAKRGEVPMASRIKRLRKNVRRHEHALRCWEGNPCRRYGPADKPVGVIRGQ